MQISNVLSGFSLGRADVLRKAMGKKSPELMAEQKRDFVDGAVQRGKDARKVEELWDHIEQFAGYGFNKSHSAAYALIAYQTAYLKAHYPREFMAALLTCDRDNADKVIKDIAECREMEIPVLPPDLNASEKDFVVEGESIRFGLAAVKNVGEAMVDGILESRNADGPFLSLDDFCRRVDHKQLNRRAVESLIKAGAIDSLNMGRAQAVGVLESVMESTARERRSIAVGQGTLFTPDEVSPAAANLPEVPEWADSVRLGFEREMLGFYISGHPLSDYTPIIGRFTNMDSRRLGELGSTQKVRMAGIIRSSRIRTTRAGRRMATMLLEDQEGTAEMTLFPNVFEQNYTLLDAEEPVFIEGNAEVSDDGVQVLVQSIGLLSEVEKGHAQRIVLQLQPGEQGFHRLSALRDVLSKYPGECPVRISLRFEDREVQVEAGRDFVVAPSDELTAELCDLVGTEAVYFE
jgi:DNA polymerase-3 subunit alpha